LRRRARRAEPVPVSARPAQRRPRRGVGIAWLAIALVVAATLAFLFVWPASSDNRPAASAERSPAVAPPTPTTGPSPDVAVTPIGCVDVGDPVVIRPIDPRLRAAVLREWRRIERALRSHDPVAYRQLGRPAKARTIAIAESQMGVLMPPDLRASLQRHNGFTIEGRRYPSIREIRDTWRRTCGTDVKDNSLLETLVGWRP
ncbi:MAG: hypothetical protein HOY71_36990, partial [Nonomuraea sp.]|nr:hypothetical protein [Nonomuraea sp.]